MNLRLALFCVGVAAIAQTVPTVPARVPPKRSSQIQNGFGINSDLPRDPYLPWNRWWWTRMFDAGVSWIRIGQYENSSDPTSWDWVEQQRGVFAIAPEVDDYVDSLIDNGVKVQVQLMYGNPMYTSPSGIRPDRITPKPGGFHNDDRSIDSIFWPPKTPDEIEAFLRYVKWMVNHFRGRIHYYALWNEQDIGYWNPRGNPEEYGRLLAAFAPAVHAADPQAKVIYGGQADPISDFAKRALDECRCAAQIDIYAYHTYPGYGKNVEPERMDSGAYGKESPAKLRRLVRNYPGIRKDIEFWDDEFNSIPSWPGSDESVQARYIPRGMLYNLAAGVRTFVWLLAAGVDGNEYDDFGLIHGLRNLPDDFTPRPVFHALQNTNALFSDTKFDPSIGVTAAAPFLRYGFRNRNGKAIIAYWAPAHSVHGVPFPSQTATLTLRNTGIRNPVLIDVVSGDISPLSWNQGTRLTVPVRDSVSAIADASYFDWPILPEAPSGLTLDHGELRWELHGDAARVAVERRVNNGPWQRIATQPAATHFTDTAGLSAALVSYRVRALNAGGESAYSNVLRVHHDAR
ncbi:MAG: hypothetical protein M3O35_22330 [Acidobacteriota bacterium]|nr:hypothetical protein [Acidobacteriota bacterium]